MAAKLGNTGPMVYSVFQKVSQLPSPGLGSFDSPKAENKIHSIVQDACVHAHGNRVVQTNGYDVSKSMDFSNSRGSNRKRRDTNEMRTPTTTGTPKMIGILTTTGTFSTIAKTPDKQEGRNRRER